MSKQSQANTIFKTGIEQGLVRGTIIDEIMTQIGVKSAYASTLYATAKRQTGSTVTTKPPMQPIANSKPATKHVKPVARTASTITEFDNKDVLRMMRAEINDALAAVATKHGVTIDLGNISYSSSQFTTKLTVQTGDGSDAAVSKWNLNAWRFNLAEDQIGDTFMSNGTEFTITGMNPRRKKFPISAVNARGTGYKFPASKGKPAH